MDFSLSSDNYEPFGIFIDENNSKKWKSFEINFYLFLMSIYSCCFVSDNVISTESETNPLMCFYYNPIVIQTRAIVIREK